MAITRRQDSRIGIGEVMVLSRDCASIMQQTIIDTIRKEIKDRLEIDYFHFSDVVNWQSKEMEHDKSKIDKPILTWQEVATMVENLLTDDNASSFIKDIVSILGFDAVFNLTMQQLQLESQVLKCFGFNYGNESENIGALFSQVRTDILESKVDEMESERKAKEVAQDNAISQDLKTIASEKWHKRKGNATIFQDLTSIVFHKGYQPTQKAKANAVQSLIDDNMDAYFSEVKKVVLNSSDKVNSFVRNANDDVIIKLVKRFSIPENLAVDLWLLMQNPNKSTD